MKRLLKLALLSIFLCFFTGTVFSQLSDIVTPREKILEAIGHIKDERYGAAQSLLDDFGVNDSFYESSGYYLVICYDNQADYENAFKVAKRFAQDLTVVDREVFYSLAGAASFFGKNHQEGAALLEEGIAIFNKDVRIYNQLAKNYIMLGEDSLAYHYSIEGLKINPFSQGLLENIGELNARQGNYTQASMAWYLALFSKYHKREFNGMSYTLISKLEGILGGDYKAKDFPFNWNGLKTSLEDYEKLPMPTPVSSTFKINNYYPKTDEVLESKIALNARYKSKTKLNYKFAKQGQIMVESLPAESKPKKVGADFFIYHDVLEDLLVNVTNDVKLLRPFQNAVLGLIDNSKANAYLSKKYKKEVFPANVKMGKIVSASMQEIPIFYDGKVQKVSRRFSSYNFDLYAAGSLIDEAKVDLKANRKGWWQFYNDNGFIESDGAYNNGEKIGVWTEFDKKGQKNEEYKYEKNELVGYKSFEENGLATSNKKLAKGELKDSSFFYYPDGALKSWLYLPNGEKNIGRLAEFSPFGVLKLNSEIKNFELNGDYEYKNENNITVYKTTYKTGKKDGMTMDYYATGELYSKGNYKDGLKDGVWEYFDYDGNRTNSFTYSKGEKEGKQTSYFKDRTLKAENNYKAGKKEGVQKYFNEKGVVINEETYSADKLTAVKNFDNSGKEINSKNKLDGNSVSITTKHPNGIMASEGSLKNGLDDGTWKYYTELGVLYKAIEYKRGELNGEVINYFSSGAKSSEYFTKNDERDGLYISYFSNGKKYETGYFKKGEKYGEWLTYQKDGALIKKYYYLDDEMIGFQNDYDAKGKINNSTYYKNGWSYYKVSFDSTEQAIDTLYYVSPVSNIYYDLSVVGDTTFLSPLLHNQLNGQASSYQMGKLVTNSLYKMGVLQGSTVRKNILGQNTTASWFVDGKMVKGEDYYEESGVRSYIGVYKRGKLDSVSTYFYPNGEVSLTTTYINGSMGGKQTRYTPDGNIAYVLMYKDGDIYSYGSSEADQTVVDKKLIRAKYTYENGKAKAQFNIKNGELDSNWTIFYKTGTPAETRHYEYGHRNGVDTLFFSNGQINEIETYNFADYSGVRKRYDSNGNLLIERNYLNDVLHGWEYLYQNGKLVKKSYYYNGDIISTN